ncbi:MAG: LysM peptidoglycan-binding domain-containing protein [Cyclobacteriaceae bacterium]
MRFLFILCSLGSFTLEGAGLEFDSIRSEVRGDLLYVIHEVEEEETLYSIAKRYKSSVPTIIESNNITDSRIKIGQILSILFEETPLESDSLMDIPDGFHLVLEGETLYSISKLYDLRIRELRRLNQLESNAISPGEYLRVSTEAVKVLESDTLKIQVEESDSVYVEAGIPEGFEEYIVQTAETLNSIAKKRGIGVEALKEWNNLDSDYIKIGQSLWVRQMTDSIENVSDSTLVLTKLNADGFEKVYQEGIAGIISDISTTKYLALHRSMPIGTELEVRNLMNNFVVHVKVVGKLPNTGLNRNVLLRLSKPAFEQLGILDPKSRVEVSHFKK